MKRALFIGRFQPFHHGHYYAIRKLLKKFKEVVVVIGSSEDGFTAENPFTCGERIEMMRLCFNKGELARMVLIPVPDVNDNRLWVDHLYMHIPPVDIDSVYSNNALVKMLFSKHGVLVRAVDYYDRGPKEGTNIRKLMGEGNREWAKHVPRPVVKYLELIEAEQRIKKIIRMGGRHV